jgi:uncharacterized membrane protein YhaH (DUF805 family)
MLKPGTISAFAGAYILSDVATRIVMIPLTAATWALRDIGNSNDMFIFINIFNTFLFFAINLGLFLLLANVAFGWLHFLFTFQGRASRSQFWLLYVLPILGIEIVYATAMVATAVIRNGGSFDFNIYNREVMPMLFVFGLAMLWPRIAVSVKRFHDRGKSGWMYLIGFIPIVGPIWLLIDLGILPGQRGENQYGPDPLEPAPA